jgi:hypothetical protein
MQHAVHYRLEAEKQKKRADEIGDEGAVRKRPPESFENAVTFEMDMLFFRG